MVECSEGKRGKFAYDPTLGGFELKRLLPAGTAFPLNFGFVPSTKADDGDPLDVMVIHDVPLPMGALVQVRLIGVIEAEQTEDGQTVRNDRLIGITTSERQRAASERFRTLGGAEIRATDAREVDDFVGLCARCGRRLGALPCPEGRQR